MNSEKMNLFKSKLYLLTKVQLLSYFGINKALHEGPSGRLKLTGTGAFAVIILCILGFSCYGMCIGIAESMVYVGGPMEAIPAVMLISATLLILISGIYQASSLLFRYRDYEITMALPVSVATVAASRIMVLYLTEMVFVLITMVPAGIAYMQYASPPIAFYPAYSIMLLAVPLIPLTISSLLGTLVAAVSSRMRRFSNAVAIVLTFVVSLGSIAVQFAFQGEPDDLAAVFGDLVVSLTSGYPPALMFVRGACENDFLSFTAFIVLSLGIFSVFFILLSTRYRELYSRVSQNTADKKSKEGFRQKTPLYALYRREMSRLLSSYIYVTNTLIGVIMALASCAMVVFTGGIPGLTPEISAEYGLDAIINRAMPPFLAMLFAMSSTTGSAISLEGKQVWIVKTLPVRSNTVFLSKILVNLTFSIPASVICSAAMAFKFKPGAMDTVLLFVMPLSYAVFTAVFGLYVNLHMPKLDWQTEAQAVKQSAASMISMFCSMLLPLIVFIFAMSFNLPFAVMLVVSAIPLALAAFIGAHLTKHGDRLMARLG